jgi:hypothetical protein
MIFQAQFRDKAAQVIPVFFTGMAQHAGMGFASYHI